MKEAMWGVGLIMLAVFGIFLISLFGNITVTNQQDYTAMKNTVEAAINDAIDIGLYRSGFCFCTNVEKDINGKYVFENSNQYEILELKEDGCKSDKYSNCDLIEGEYIIDKKVFTESLVRRFAESVKGNYNYQLIVEDVIEYPPKVSVNIKSSNTYEVGGGNYTIDNRIDAILETNNLIVETYEKEPETYNVTVHHYAYDINGHKGTTTKVHDDVVEKKNKGEKYSYSALSSSVLKSGYRNYKPLSTQKYEGVVENDNIEIIIYYYKPNVKYTPSCPPDCPQISPPNIPKPEKNTKKPESSGGGRCFLIGTKIAVRDGYKNIEEINANDYVLTFNRQTGKNEYKKVTYVFESKNANEILYTIETDDTEISLTRKHNIYVNRNNELIHISAEELKKGDKVFYSDGTYHNIVEITKRPINETVYNLEIDGNSNFYVGDKKILVHHGQRLEITDEVHGDAMDDKNST